jgi:4-aminobutyrate aminotransferase-like enzyme
MEFPIIRIELENMRHQIIHHLGAHHEELEKYVSEQVKKAVDDFDYRDAVRRLAAQAVQDAVKKAVEYFFFYGKGKETVERAVRDSLEDMYRDAREKGKP